MIIIASFYAMMAKDGVPAGLVALAMLCDTAIICTSLYAGGAQ